MTINIRPVVTEISVRFFGRGLSHIEISRITLGVKRWHLKSPVPCSYHQQSCPGVTWLSVKDDYMIRRPCIMKGNTFFSVSRIEVELTRQIRRRIFLCMVQRRLVVAGYRSKHPDRCPDWQYATHIGIPSPELEPSALISCDICWCVQGQPLPLWSACFLDTTIY